MPVLIAKPLTCRPLQAKPLTVRALGAGDDTWPADMLASYRALNPEQATWFDAAGSAVETELLARLQPGGYLHTTFGPSGQNKAACDFVFVLLTVGDVVTQAITKSGVALRWDIDGTVTTQNNLPAHTLGVGAGVLTCSSTDGWSGVTNFRIYDNQFSGAAPLWVLPNCVGFLIYSNQFSGAAPLWVLPNCANFSIQINQFSGTAPNWDLPSVAFFYIHINQFSGAAPLWALPSVTVFSIRSNQFSGTAPLWALPSVTGFYIYSNQFSSISAPLPSLIKVSDLQAYDNGLSQAEVDAALAAIYNNWAGYTDATPELNISGTNAAPSGAYADEDPPTTGLGHVYELANDPEGTLNEKWIITYTGGVAP